MVVCPSSFVVRGEVARNTGFNTNLRYSEDSEFLFRLAMRTGFCFVNRPLVWFDRSPAEVRHVGVAADWNKQDFFLRNCQLRLEGLLRLSDSLPPHIKKVIQEELRSIHSGWANWYLQTGHYGKARAAAFKAVHMNLTFNVAVKWLLTWISPGLALRTVLQRENKRASEFTV